MGSERKRSALGFLKAALAYYESLGVKVERVMTDNGSCYRSFAFRAACKRLGLHHITTRPYRPQTNGKVERFWRTLDDDVIDDATFDNLDHFANELFEYLIYYNNHRPHQALAEQTPKALAAAKTTAIKSAN